MFCTAAGSFLLWDAVKKSRLDDPLSTFYRFTPLLNMAEGILASVTYIYYFLFMLSNLASVPSHDMKLAVLIASVQTFWSIGSDNYNTYRRNLENTHLPKEKSINNDDHQKWTVQ